MCQGVSVDNGNEAILIGLSGSICLLGCISLIVGCNEFRKLSRTLATFLKI